MLKRLKNKIHSENIYRIFIYKKIIIIEAYRRKSIHLKRIELRIKSKEFARKFIIEKNRNLYFNIYYFMYLNQYIFFVYVPSFYHIDFFFNLYIYLIKKTFFELFLFIIAYFIIKIYKY